MSYLLDRIYPLVICIILVSMVTILVMEAKAEETTGTTMEVEVEQEMENDMIFAQVRIVGNGVDEELTVSDLADGETKTYQVSGLNVEVTRQGDLLSVTSAGELDGKLVLSGSDKAGHQKVWVQKSEGEGIRKVVLVDTDCEDDEHGEHAVIIRKMHIGEDDSDGEDDGREVKIVVVGKDGRIRVNGDEIDIDLEEIGRKVEEAMIKVEKISLKTEDLAELAELKALKCLDLSQLEDLRSLDIDMSIDAEELKAEIEQARNMVVYRCPDDGATIRVPKDKDKGKYKCPVCKEKMQKVDEPVKIIRKRMEKKETKVED